MGVFMTFNILELRMSAYVDGKNASLYIETDFATDVTDLLEIGA